MKDANKIVRKFAIEFIDNNWDKINLDKVEITETKEKFINKLKRDNSLCTWVITEIMTWGCDKDYIEEYEIRGHEDEEGYELFIIKIKEDYLKLHHINDMGSVEFRIVEPKYKQVVYFE